MKIIGIYKITNTITNDFYIGSSKNVKRRWAEHKCQSIWKKYPNKQLYQDMRKYGTDKFVFEVLEVLEVVEPEKLKEAEQKFIELLKPTYNDRNANGWDIERQKKHKNEYQKEYNKSDKGKEAQKKYHKSEKYKNYQKEHQQSDKGKKYKKKSNNKYKNQLCFYNGETLTLNALYQRFQRADIEHPIIEAKKYLLNKSKDK